MLKELVSEEESEEEESEEEESEEELKSSTERKRIFRIKSL